MPDKYTIMKEIESSVGTNFATWTIGLTDDPSRRINERGNPAYWNDWQANSELDAQEIFDHFTNLGMQKDELEEGVPANYVYVY